MNRNLLPHTLDEGSRPNFKNIAFQKKRQTTDSVQNISNHWAEYTNGARTVNTTPAILTGIFRGFSQTPRKIAGTEPPLGHDPFLRNIFQFVIY
jgi:hypothetical protein